mgnify:CR=1 FL=1|tara:strand:+ start:34 stop:354 length:321 start_codon:yes stop_codon:yes gene_type:complete
MKNKFLYFRDAADDALLVSADKLIAMCQTADQTMVMYFEPRSNDAAEVDSVRLVIGDEKEVAIMDAIVDAINYSREDVIVVCDLVNNDFLHEEITSSQITFSNLAD